MKKRTIPLIVNPVAGRGRAVSRIPAISKLLDASGVAHEVIQSTVAGDIETTVLAAASAGAERIIVAGGDGSIHEAVNGIMRAATATALGVIPFGTGNDFAKACSIPLHWEDATLLLAERIANKLPWRYIDAGRMNDRYFANGAGIGFDAKINRIASRNRLPIGDLKYLIAVFKGVWDGVITPRVSMRYDTENYEGAVTLIEVCNGPSVGGIFQMAPAAKNDDGYLDLIFVKPVSRLRIFALLPRLLHGTHETAPEVTCARITSIGLTAEAPLPSHLDGENQPPGTKFDIEILPRALAIL
jgi:YegS/Rv2252/BmrU family lipid kinase